MSVTLDTPILDLANERIGRLTVLMARKLATALAQVSRKSDITEVTVGDLLHYFPARYEDRSNLVEIDDLKPGLEAAVEIVVRNVGGVQVGRNRDPRRPPLFIFEITGGDGERRFKPVVVKWFISGRNAKAILAYYENRFSRGTRLVAYGLWEWDERKATFSLRNAKPDELEILPEIDDVGLFAEEDEAEADRSLAEDDASPEFAMVHTARRVPVYRKLGEFQTKRLREIVHSVLTSLKIESTAESLPAELLERQGLLGYGDAIRQIHFPPDDSNIADYETFRSPAQRRLIFEEFFWLSFSMQLLRGERQKEPKGTVIEIADATSRKLQEFLPFQLTNAQKRVVGEILNDLQSDAPMNRLIQGDVGSGKTIVAFLAAMVAIENGYQVALMAPTEILAEQHFRNAEQLFKASGYRCDLLIGSLKAVQKRSAQLRVSQGEADLIIGTHALIQDKVRFERLGLAIVDEQHRFGVLQRAQLRAGGHNPDVLVMTATPIPRSLAMTIYGDLDVSIIDEMPPGRTPIKTVVLGEDKRPGVYRGIEREVSLGRQVYVVYPLIEDSEKSDLKAAKAMYEKLRDQVFPQHTVGLLHGKMKAAEKQEVMAKFVAGRIDILVSTTVIEVGVDVPNATLMVIEHAERFGLSQLHQLRGRVGRASEKSYCVLLADFKQTSVAKQRLGIMEETSDGFKIAEKDLEIRGQGEILGTRQSGIQNFRLGNIARDLDVLIAARDEAEYYLTKRRTSSETLRMIKAARSDKNVRLGTIG